MVFFFGDLFVCIYLDTPKAMIYKTLELVSSYSDLQKLTCIGCASRLRFVPSTTTWWVTVSLLQVDRNLVGYLPRLAVLVSIAADRPGGWFPGPLGPYQAWFPGIELSRDFKRA
jgi:hypothetical protein